MPKKPDRKENGMWKITRRGANLTEDFFKRYIDPLVGPGLFKSAAEVLRASAIKAFWTDELDAQEAVRHFLKECGAGTWDAFIPDLFPKKEEKKDG